MMPPTLAIEATGQYGPMTPRQQAGIRVVGFFVAG